MPAAVSATVPSSVACRQKRGGGPDGFVMRRATDVEHPPPDVPTLILHGDDDQIVPIGAAAMLSSKLVKGATLKVHPSAPHGMCSTEKDKINADLLAFIKG